MINSPNPAIGIDLGTTNTVVGFQLDSTGPQILQIPQPNVERRHLDQLPHIKSAVLFETDSSAVVGAWAANRLDSFHSIKSHMGTRWRGRNPATGALFEPSYISAHILKLAHQTIATTFPSWDQTALITVPASFNTDQRYDTLTAASLAGFKGIRLLDEPTAAFYYFLNQQIESLTLREIKNILIFDFGGGTLDVSVITVEHQNNELFLDAFGRSRYNNLGGDDIDLELATFLIGVYEFDAGQEITNLPAKLKNQLYMLFIDKARRYKEEVEDYLKNDLGMPEFIILNEQLSTGNEFLNINFKRLISEIQYEDITGRYLQSKSDLNIYRPIEEALAVAQKLKADFSRDQIDLILYTGGASNMASVQRALKAYFSPKPCFSISVEDACNTVALGAAFCRYEELYGTQRILMSNRLLEGIFTRQSDERHYTELVPLTCEPSKEFIKVNRIFRLERPIIKLRLPLFRGVSAVDHQLSPVRDLVIPLDQVIDKDTTYEIFYKMTENKTLELKVLFQTKTGGVETLARLDLFDEQSHDESELALYEVNTI